MSILKNYNCSLVRALRSVFPEMKPHLRGRCHPQSCYVVARKYNSHPPFFLSPPLDEKTPKGYWQDPKNCRSFFDEYAEEKGFDPLDLANGWHTLHVNNFLVKTVPPSLSLQGNKPSCFPAGRKSYWRSTWGISQCLEGCLS